MPVSDCSSLSNSPTKKRKKMEKDDAKQQDNLDKTGLPNFQIIAILAGSKVEVIGGFINLE